MQLETAEEDILDAENSAEEHSERLLFQAQLFQHEQADIERRLQATASSEATHEVARQLQESTDKLHRLQVARGYLEFVQVVYKLRFANPPPHGRGHISF